MEILENNYTNDDNSETIIQPQKPKKQTFKTDNGFFVFIFVFALAFMATFYTFNIFFVPIKVVGTSMQPTINISVLSDIDQNHCDVVYYQKHLAYSHGDIIILENNNQKYVDDDSIEYLIKRIIATGGDVIKFIPYTKALESDKVYYNIEVTDQNGNLIVSNEDYIKEEMFYYSRGENSLGNHYYAIEYETFGEIYNNLIQGKTVSFVIPENQLFVMGDNRNNSTDSRVFGAVDISDIAGSMCFKVDYGETLFDAVLEKIKN